MYGKKYMIAKSELLILFSIIRLKDFPYNPHSAKFILIKKPNKVNNIPLKAGCVLTNLKINIGAIKIAIGIVGKKILYLLSTKIPNPSINKITD
jgi:hypothetical protein